MDRIDWSKNEHLFYEYSDMDLAKKLGKSFDTIRDARRRRGIKKRTRGNNSVGRVVDV